MIWAGETEIPGTYFYTWQCLYKAIFNVKALHFEKYNK